jgi:hypothetical protein
VAGAHETAEADKDESAETEPPAPQREGLPAGFRMRHDPHYVEELLSRNQGSRVPAADDQRVQAPSEAVRGLQPGNGRHVLKPEAALSTATAYAEIGESLDAVGACLHLFRDTPRPALERSALNLIGAEVCRATWLVQALRVLDDDPPVANEPVDLGSVAAEIVRALAPGRHHAGATLEVDASAPDLRARGDRQLLTVAVAGIVMALQAATERIETAVVQVRVREEAGDRVRVDAAQDALRLPASWRNRFLDLQWTDRPGGRRVAVALAASRRIAELHRGTLTMEDSEHGGCRLVLSLPRI